MPVNDVLINDDIVKQLGEAGLREVCACLWAVDCQTCGRFLGEDPPAMCVDDMLLYAAVGLHHHGCRSPYWNDSGVIHLQGSAEAYLSHITCMIDFPIAVDGGLEYLPMLLVNPGLEQVILERDQTQRWRVQPGGAAGVRHRQPALGRTN
jgi:hypothetical protein